MPTRPDGVSGSAPSTGAPPWLSTTTSSSSNVVVTSPEPSDSSSGATSSSDTIAPRSSRESAHTRSGSGCQTITPGVDGADVHTARDGDRVDDLVRAGVDDLEFAGRRVVGDDGGVGLLDVELRAGIRDPDETGDLTGGAVHLSDDAVGPAHQPGATVVGLGADGGAGVGVDRGDDHGGQRGDHEADHDHFA